MLVQKAELGLLDGALPEPPAAVDLNPPEMRAVARQLAEASVVLPANPSGALPLAPDARIAVVGPLADDPAAMLGCYTFPRHVGVEYPELPKGIDVPTRVFELERCGGTHTDACCRHSGTQGRLPPRRGVSESDDTSPDECRRTAQVVKPEWYACAPELARWRQERRVRVPVRISLTRISGCSKGAKCPPLSASP